MGTVTINSITINNASTANGHGPFNGKTAIKSVDLKFVPWTNNSMDNGFRQCTNLTDVYNINKNITNMAYAFYGCWQLTNAPTIPNSVTDMDHTFFICNSLTTAPVIPNSVTNICYCFEHCGNLMTVPPLPTSILTMNYTFHNCNSLTIAPIIPNSVQYLANTFCDCRNLTTAPIIPSSINYMYGTFANCPNLTGDIYIYSTAITQAGYCFNGTALPKNVYIPYNTQLEIYTNTYNSFSNVGYYPGSTKNGVTIKENPHFKISGDWWYCDYDGMLYKYLNTSTTLIIPNTINGKGTCLDGYSAFSYSGYKIYNGRQITSLNLNNTCIINSLVSFLAGANYITSIQNINVGSNVKNASFAFEGCSSLTSAPSLPDGITEMINTYKDCSALTSMPTLPNTVINAPTLFYQCDFNSWSTAMVFPDSIENYSGITSTNKDPNKAFNITIGKNAINISASFGKFYGNCYIRSNQITNAGTCFQFRNNFRKNVYIPFKNTDGTNSATYNAFISAGYRTDGSFCNTYLINYTALYSEY